MRRIGAYNETRNPYLKPLVDSANALYFLGKVKSYREFSTKYLNRTSNYMNVLLYNTNKNPSIAVLLRLYKKLSCKKSLEN